MLGVQGANRFAQRPPTRSDQPSSPLASLRIAWANTGVMSGSLCDIEGAIFMSKWLAIFLSIVAAFALTIGGLASGSATRTLCSDSWYRLIAENVPTSDEQGHGPDIGSDEWKSVIEFKPVFGTSRIFRVVTPKPGAVTSVKWFWRTALHRKVSEIPAELPRRKAPRSLVSMLLAVAQRR